MNRIIKNLFLLFFCFCASAQGQPVFNFQELRDLYPGNDAVILNQTQHIVITKSDEKLKIKTDKVSQVLFLTDKASHMLNKSIYNRDFFSKISDIEAYSLVPDPDGRKLRKKPVQNFYTRKAVSDDIFYDDIKETYFTFPSLKKGAVSSLSYTEEIFDPHFISPFYFGAYIPVENAELKVTFPEDMVIKYVIKDPSGVVSFDEKRSKNNVTYTFRMGRSKGYRTEDSGPDGSYFIPHVIVYIDSYKQGAETKKVLSDVDQLYNWYRELLSRMKNEPSEDLQALADSLTGGEQTEEDKIRKVFYYVQENIKYIAIEDGLGGFIPGEPDETYHKKYGDCKAKAMLINTLLGYAGINAYPVWIGTRDIPYSYTEVPTPNTDNHMISAVKVNDKWVFLDGTSRHLPYGMPTSMIQGKEGLIGISEDHFQVVKVPEMSGDKNIAHDTFDARIEGEKISGHGSHSCTGYIKQDLMFGLEFTSAEKRLDALGKSAELGENKYKAENVKLYDGYKDRDSALVFSYDFEIEDYLTKVEDQIYVNLNFRKDKDYDKIDIDKRLTDLIQEYKWIEIVETSLEIPEGYKVSKIPAKSNYTDKRFGFNVVYKVEGNKVLMNKEVYTDTLIVSKPDFVHWNNFVDELIKSNSELVVLEKIKP